MGPHVKVEEASPQPPSPGGPRSKERGQRTEDHRGSRREPWGLDDGDWQSGKTRSKHRGWVWMRVSLRTGPSSLGSRPQRHSDQAPPAPSGDLSRAGPPRHSAAQGPEGTPVKGYWMKHTQENVMGRRVGARGCPGDTKPDLSPCGAGPQVSPVRGQGSGCCSLRRIPQRQPPPEASQAPVLPTPKAYEPQDPREQAGCLRVCAGIPGRKAVISGKHLHLPSGEHVSLDCIVSPPAACM